MACGSVCASEGSLPPRDITPLTPSPQDSRKPPPHALARPLSPALRGGVVHEAVRFLQAEHEAVLRGLHQQIQLLQHRCDDLQFEAHLRHVTLREDDAWRQQVRELNQQLEERTKTVSQLQEELEAERRAVEEAAEQHRWREVQLQQQVEAGERRVADLKGEVTKLRAQVRDLKVYSSALRTMGGRAPSRPTSRPAHHTTSAPRPLSRASRASVGSQESLESSGPRSLGSEDGEAGAWREARLGGSGRVTRHTRPPLSPVPRVSTFSLPPSLHSPPPSLPPLASLPPPRPTSSSTIVLPPITPAITGPRQVRRQMRLSSAPAHDIERNGPVPHRDPA